MTRDANSIGYDAETIDLIPVPARAALAAAALAFRLHAADCTCWQYGYQPRATPWWYHRSVCPAAQAAAGAFAAYQHGPGATIPE